MSTVSSGCLKREVGMTESQESLVILVYLEKLHIIGDRHFSQRCDQKQFQVPDAKETWIS